MLNNNELKEAFLGVIVTKLVGRAVCSNCSGPQFESSHRQIFIYLYLLSTILKRRK